MDHKPEVMPCPFCGNDELTAEPDTTYVMCHGCDADGPMTKPGGAIKAWNTRTAPAEDVRAVGEELTPQYYAIEHAGFLATAADQVLADYQAYTLAQMLADEGGDDGEAELTDAIDEARDDLHEGLRNLREMAYEFRTRRDRAVQQQPRHPHRPVVLPERKEIVMGRPNNQEDSGWNACIEEFKMINPGADILNAVLSWILGPGREEDPMTFLHCWTEGKFDLCREEWPQAPKECYPVIDRKFSPGAKHGSAHGWNKWAAADTKRHQELWISKWLPTFSNAEVGRAFSVSAKWFLPHNVARLVGDLEYQLDMQFVYTVGRPYRFMRIS